MRPGPRTRAAGRLARRHARPLLDWLVFFYALMLTVWVTSEAQQPGEQYPHPIRNVALVTVTFGTSVYIAVRTIIGAARAGQ